MKAMQVQAENIGKKMGRAQALSGVSTIFEAGKVHGVIGPNGAGKTSLYPDLSCMEHMEFFRDLYAIGEKEFKIRSEELFNATDMADFKDRPAGKLSGGMYKKLGLMCVLLNRPGLLLLDEPTIGVDPVSRQQLWDLVYKYAGRDMTVIVNTSYMDEAQRCYKVHILRSGRLLAAGGPRELMEKFKVKNFADIFLQDDK